MCAQAWGLYLLDWRINFATSAGRQETWTLEDDGITVTTTCEARVANVEPSRQATLREVTVRREVYPQEFLLFLAQRPEFEFIGWWNHWGVTRLRGN